MSKESRLQSLALRMAYYPAPVTKLQRYTEMSDYEVGREAAEEDPKKFAGWLHEEDSGGYWDSLTDEVREKYIIQETGDENGKVNLDSPSVVSWTWDELDLDNVSEYYIESYGEYLRDQVRSNIPRSTTPSNLDFSPIRKVTNEWLVHFTGTYDKAEQIAAEGFTLGTENHKYLSVTENKYKFKEGYNFAYLADNRGIEYKTGTYGEHGVLFLGSGILYHQVSDSHDEQVIFWGPTARYRIPFHKKPGYVRNPDWYVGDPNRPLKTSKSLSDLLKWCIAHAHQYRKQLIPAWKGAPNKSLQKAIASLAEAVSKIP